MKCIVRQPIVSQCVIGATLMVLAQSAPISRAAAPVELVEQAPVEITKPTEGVTRIDFRRVAFGNIELTPPSGRPDKSLSILARSRSVVASIQILPVPSATALSK